jgi:hypothetical protein
VDDVVFVKEGDLFTELLHCLKLFFFWVGV